MSAKFVEARDGKHNGAIIIGIPAGACVLISCRQFKEKGFLFNNAYIFASNKERETMDKSPRYKQSEIVFLLLGIVFFNGCNRYHAANELAVLL